MNNDPIDKLALAQHHDDLVKQAELTAKMITAIEALNSKEININLPENLRINQSGVTEIEGSVKAIISNAVAISNLDELGKHFESIELALTKALEAKPTEVKAKAITAKIEGIAELNSLIKELNAKDFGIAKVANQVVVFPKQAREALPVRLVMADKDKFYNAFPTSTPSFSAPDNVRINNSAEQPIPVSIVTDLVAENVGLSNASDVRINPATEETAQAIVDGLSALAGAESQEDEIAILEEIKTAIQAVAMAKGLTGELRVSVQSGAVTISSGTITTVTTVGTVSNQTNTGGFSAQPVVPSATNQTAILSNINNVVVS